MGQLTQQLGLSRQTQDEDAAGWRALVDELVAQL